MLKSNKKNIINTVASLCVAIIILLLIINPERYILSVKNGVSLFAMSVLPALFPFFFLTKILSALGSINILTDKLKKPVKYAFNMPPEFSFIFFMSLLSGYPVGSKLVSEYYGNNINSKNITEVAAICSTSGPLFIIGTVGFTLLGNKTAGLIILVSHISAVILFALFYGLISRIKEKKQQKICNINVYEKKEVFNINYSNLKAVSGNNFVNFNLKNAVVHKAVQNNNQQVLNFNDSAGKIATQNIADYKTISPSGNYKKNSTPKTPHQTNPKDYSNILGDSIESSVLSILTVGGLISIFYMIIDILADYFVLNLVENLINIFLNLFSAPTSISKGISAGLVEITRGCNLLASSSAPLLHKTIGACFIITMSGACIMAQSYAFLGKCKIKFLRFLLYKFIMSILAVVICYFIFPLFNLV